MHSFPSQPSVGFHSLPQPCTAFHSRVQPSTTSLSLLLTSTTPHLATQLRGIGRTSNTAQELATAVLSCLSVTEDGIRGIASSNCIRPLVVMLTSGTAVAQAHAASVLSDLAKTSAQLMTPRAPDGPRWRLMASVLSDLIKTSALLASDCS